MKISILNEKVYIILRLKFIKNLHLDLITFIERLIKYLCYIEKNT